MDITELLRTQAQEIAHEGHNGWGNTMIAAADEIDALRRTLNGNDGHTHYCEKCRTSYTPTGDNEDCPECGYDGT